jgi:5-formyltetrahydrofolate cyclo-ligase
VASEQPALEAPTSNDDVTQQKTELRAILTERRQSIPTIVALRAAERAAEKLLLLPEVEKARVIAAYSAVKNELDAWPAIRALLEHKKTVLLPRIDLAERKLSFHRYDPGEPLLSGQFGIAEPSLSVPPIEPTAIDLFIVPGLGFDRSGWRLGWGKGYYDRALRESSGTRVGFAYDCQILARIPHQSGDIPMDILVTEQRIERSVPR